MPRLIVVQQAERSCAVFLMDFGGWRATSGSGGLVCQLTSLGIYVLVSVSVLRCMCVSLSVLIFNFFTLCMLPLLVVNKVVSIASCRK